MTKPNIKLTREDAKVYYLTASDEVTLQMVADEFKGVRGCSYSSLVHNSADENWPELRAQHLAHCQEKAIQKAATQGSNAILERLGQIDKMQACAYEAAIDLDFKSAGEAITSLINLEELRRTITGEDISVKLDIKIPGGLYDGLGGL